MKKNILLLSIGFILLSGCTVKNETGKIKVAASIYPIAEFARAVGGEYVEVIEVSSAGQEPHDFEPTPRDIESLLSSQIFIWNGAGLELWAERLADDLAAAKVISIKMEPLMSVHLENSENENKDEALKPTIDPHFWLDPTLASEQITIIRDALIQVDPSHEVEYKANAKNYQRELATLNDDYMKGFKSCIRTTAVVSHAAFGYLDQRYHIELIPISGISPVEEPSLRQLGQIAQLAKERNVKTIFFEANALSSLAETIAKETGLKSEVLYTIETATEEDRAGGATYISLMRLNLDKLREAYECK